MKTYFGILVKNSPVDCMPSGWKPEGIVGDFYCVDHETQSMTQVNSVFCSMGQALPGKVFSIHLDPKGHLSLTGDGQLGYTLGSGSNQAGYRCDIHCAGQNGFQEIPEEFGKAIFSPKNADILQNALSNANAKTLAWFAGFGLTPQEPINIQPTASSEPGMDIPQ